MKEEFVVYRSKGKQFLLIILAIMMTIVSIFLIFTRDLEIDFLGSSSTYIITLIGIIGVILFGFASVFSVKQLFSQKPVVVLTKQGFYDYSSAMATKDRLIPWKEVSDIGVFTISGQNFISIRLKNKEDFLESLSPIARKATQANLKLGSYEINITMQSAKGVSLEELLERMFTFLEVTE